MGALKAEFQEVIAGDYGAVDDLREASNSAWDAYRALHAALPVYRTPAEQKMLNALYGAAEFAKWKLDQAVFWEEYHGRHR